MRWIAFVLLALSSLAMPSCVTTTIDGKLISEEEESNEPIGPMLRRQIDKRIEELKYKRGVALLDSLNWLVLYGDNAVPQLIEALHEPDHRTRAYVAFALGEIGNQSVIPQLREALDDEERKLVRYEIAAALVTLGDWGQIGMLIDGLADENRRNRHKSFEVLKRNVNLTFDFDPSGADADRRRSVAKWRAWWTENREQLTPVPN